MASLEAAPPPTLLSALWRWTDSASVRQKVLWVAIASTLVATTFQYVIGILETARAVWQAAGAVALLAAVFSEVSNWKLVRRWTPLIATVLLCLTAPLAFDNGHPIRLVMSVMSVLLAITFIYFDEPLVVLTASISGGVATTFVRDTIALNSTEYAEFMLSGLIINGIAAFCSFALARQRAHERQREAEKNEQLQVAERRQAQGERMALVGQLASGVAHEISNPLAYVCANVSLVRDHLEHGTSLHGERPGTILAEAQQGLDRIQQIVSDLKAFAREDTDGPKPVHVGDVVDESMRLASVNLPPGTKVEFNGRSNVMLVKANHRRLVQVLLHLLVNAADSLRQGPTRRPVVKVSVAEGPATAIIEVEDNGGGVPPNLQHRLFDPFFTTKLPGKGTGLGLAMSRETLRSLGGDLTYAPVEGGACFRVELPVHRPALAMVPLVAVEHV